MQLLGLREVALVHQHPGEVAHRLREQRMALRVQLAPHGEREPQARHRLVVLAAVVVVEAQRLDARRDVGVLRPVQGAADREGLAD